MSRSHPATGWRCRTATAASPIPGRHSSYAKAWTRAGQVLDEAARRGAAAQRCVETAATAHLVVPQGQPMATMAAVGRLRWWSRSTPALVRGDDGLMRLPPGAEPPPPAAGNVLVAGVREGSNVDAAGALVSMIELARQFEMQVRVLQSGDETARSANTLLSTR